MRLESRSPHETEEIGFMIGRMLRAGDVVGIYGELGSGKTTMVKGIARSRGVESRDVMSASFTIIAAYDTSPPFYHIDLYRIEREEELDETGIWECIGRDSIAVMEWPERLGSVSCDNMIRVQIENTGDETREISIEGLREEDWHNL